MKGTKDLTQGPILNQLFKLAAPIMATSFVQMAYSLTDIAWLSRWNTEAVAATGAVGILTWLGASISLLTKVGSEVTVAQQIGHKNEIGTRRYASHNIMISIILAIIFSITMLLWATPILTLFNLEPHITDMGIDYLRIVATAIPFTFLTMTFTGLYNAAGRSNVPFVICAIGLIVNMIMDPLFIFIFKWGIHGAAWATWLSQLIVFLIFIHQLKIKDTFLPSFKFFTAFKKSVILKIVQIGNPVTALNSLFGVFSFIITRFAVAEGGYLGLITITAVGQIEAICWNTSQGLSTALSAFVAQNFGAGRKERITSAYQYSKNGRASCRERVYVLV